MGIVLQCCLEACSHLEFVFVEELPVRVDVRDVLVAQLHSVIPV